MNSRIALASLLLALPAAGMAQGWSHQGGRAPRVFLYEHADFRGGVVVLEAGQSIENLARWDFNNGRSANDRISSIRIEGDAEVTIYVHSAFRGEALRIGGDIRDLSRSFPGYVGFNDQVSSVRVNASRVVRGPDYDHDRRRGGGNGRRNPSAVIGRPVQDVEKIIRRAYQDILEREPDASGLRHFRTMMIDRQWTEAQVRDNLRRSDEFRQVAERIVTRVYRELLRREPDPSGMNTYRRMIVERGWSEADLRSNIVRSAEYRSLGRTRAAGPHAPDHGVARVAR